MHRDDLDLTRFVLGDLLTDDLPDLAARMLAAGIDSPRLRMLAGASHADLPEDIGHEFRAAVAEAGVVLPSRLEVAERLKFHYASEVSEGRMAPGDGAREIWHLNNSIEGDLPKKSRTLGEPFGVARLLGVFLALEEFPWPGSAQADKDALERKIVQACQDIACGIDSDSDG